MALVRMREVLSDSYKGNYGVPAFNVFNLEFAKSVIETATKYNAPVIVSVHPIEIEYAGIEEITGIIKSLASRTHIPVVLHLDHGDSIETVMKCISNGFTSVMYDGSELPFEQNIANTKEIVRIAHMFGVDVEGEIGLIGGAEGDDYAHTEEFDADQLTDPLLAKEFVDKTGIDSLAVAIGSAHGLYRGEPKIDVDRLKEIYNVTDIPLVLHGGSGTPEHIVKEVIKYGITKINIASDLKFAFYKSLKDNLSDDYEPRNFLGIANKASNQLVKEKLELFETINKAIQIREDVSNEKKSHSTV
ncbi:ketose-bisphosphate aldolase [Aquibacillus halophilus]|uniref:Ketose-bisphosphate aldolase n=1 Tax=Aquibacillus halophilus TaxID=930132 RepID=A0A6A8D7Q1_9BACI|nr:class II fructose-bisphosphate aldolase [Aquibacillus halophilus]MRH41618.1 ketose-bisphosphate aldolase [Aquibacillus halophilus]